MSETPTPEPLKPDTGEEIAELRRQLERADTIINLRNQEIAALNSRLAGKDEIIAEAAEQIENLEFELAAAKEANKLMHSKIEELRSPAPTSTPIAIELPGPPDPIELTKKLNALITKRNKFLATEDVARILKE